jgi:Amt family ammonium transporter
VYSFVMTAIIALVINLVIKNRVTEEEELEGLDTAIHGESAYEFGPTGHLGGSGGVTSSLPRATVDA